MQINNLKKRKKYIHYNSDYLSNHFGFTFLDISSKTFSKKAIIEDEKIKILKFIKKDIDKKNKKDADKMFFYKKPVLIRNKSFNSSLGLDIINLNSAVAEATVIKTAISILKEEGYTNFQIVLNAIGNKESLRAWRLQLSKYYRSEKNKLKASEQKNITQNPGSIFFSDKKYLKEINDKAPTPLEFLSTKNIEHFQNVINFLESFKLDYAVDEKMVGEKQIFSKTIFKIFAKNPKTKNIEEVAFGGRYDELAAKTMHKRKFSAIGLNLNFTRKDRKKVKLKDRKINIHLLKIGSAAKLKFLDVIETLGILKAPIKYDIKEEKISKQIKKAIKDEADYIIILGENEAKQDKIVLRKMKDYSQIEVPTKDIKKYINKIIK